MISKTMFLSVFFSIFILTACGQKKAVTKTATQKQLPAPDKKLVEPKKAEPKINTLPIKKPIKKKSIVIKPKDIKPTPTKAKVIKKIRPSEPQFKKPKKPLKTAKDLTGKISINTNKVKDKNIDLQSTVVYFKPESNQLIPSKKMHKIETLNKRFVPDVLVITKGSSVAFPNMDRILHNVFSVSNTMQFDLGLYSAGNQKSVTFDKEGIVYVHCNVHHSMQADILVLDTPFYTQVDENGGFSLKNLPNVKGDLFVWHPRSQLKKIAQTKLNDLSNVQIELEITRKKIPAHMNKFGKSYRKVRK